MEQLFWERLQKIAAERGTTLGKLVAEIDSARECGNLSSVVRLFILADALSRVGK
jgi:predicted DNA-binding ribbon-helix-helix protein